MTCSCGALVSEDLAFAEDAVLHCLDLRQWRCLNGHSFTLGNTIRPLTTPARYCDVCEQPVYNAHGARRHPTCQAQHERARAKAKYRAARRAVAS